MKKSKIEKAAIIILSAIGITLGIILFGSCSKQIYIAQSSPLVVSAVGTDDGKFVVEAYGTDTNGNKQYTYLQTDSLYRVGDTIWMR